MLKEYKLENGLKIVVQEDHRAPVVVSQMWYRVGGADEFRGITGISHALEHVMFLGTKQCPQDQFSKRIGKLGGYENAYTTEDQTVYYEEIGAEHLETCLALEADRMKNLLFEPKTIDRELEVIKEERRLRVEDDPQSMTWERFFAAAHVAGPYHHPVIGWMEDIEHLSLEDLKNWYQQFYAPNHAVLIVVGDVDPEVVYGLAQKHFGALSSAAPQDPKPKKEIPVLGKRSVDVHAKAQLSYLIMGYDAPSFATTDNEAEIYGLMVLQSVLDGGLSARFEKSLIRKQQIASSVQTQYDPFQRYKTLFIISAIPAEKRDNTSLQQAVERELENLQTTLISSEELQRAKTNLIADYIYDKDSISNQAMQLGLWVSLGHSAQKSQEFEEKIQAVSAKALQTVAQKYLTLKRQTVANLIPEP